MGRNKRESQTQSDMRVIKSQDTMKVPVDTINRETQDLRAKQSNRNRS